MFIDFHLNFNDFHGFPWFSLISTSKPRGTILKLSYGPDSGAYLHRRAGRHSWHSMAYEGWACWEKCFNLQACRLRLGFGPRSNHQGCRLESKILACGPMGPLANGPKGPWAHGLMGSWVRALGSKGPWAHEWVQSQTLHSSMHSTWFVVLQEILRNSLIHFFWHERTCFRIVFILVLREM